MDRFAVQPMEAQNLSASRGTTHFLVTLSCGGGGAESGDACEGAQPLEGEAGGHGAGGVRPAVPGPAGEGGVVGRETLTPTKPCPGPAAWVAHICPGDAFLSASLAPPRTGPHWSPFTASGPDPVYSLLFSSPWAAANEGRNKNFLTAP